MRTALYGHLACRATTSMVFSLWMGRHYAHEPFELIGNERPKDAGWGTSILFLVVEAFPDIGIPEGVDI